MNIRPRSKTCRGLAVMLSLALVLAGVGSASGQAALPPSLKTVPTPEPVNLGLFLNSSNQLNAQGFPIPTKNARAAAIALGKALFWDMQAGSDGQACGSCHFHAGVDSRARNQINPNTLGGAPITFEVDGPNGTVAAGDFPFFQVTDPDAPPSATNPTTNIQNDVISSQGVFLTDFVSIGLAPSAGPGLPDNGQFTTDLLFQVDGPKNTRRVKHFSNFRDGRACNIFNGGKDTRRVEPRNTPTIINAVFNFSNFWDGRARNIFNGVSPIGELDPDAKIFVNTPDNVLVQQTVRIPDASLASQAVGPPLSNFEMSFGGRTFPDLGKKMLQDSLQPLAGQPVAADDSVFGLPNALNLNLVGACNVGLVRNIGHDQTYVALIKMAFQPQYWNSKIPIGNYTQMEANFSLFWGLAIQMYEATLRADDTKFDRVQEGRDTFTASEQAGANIFFGAGNCSACHDGPEFTGHSIANIRQGIPATPPGFLPAAAIVIDAADPSGGGTTTALFDESIYNTAVTPISDDVCRGAPIGPLNLPLSFSELALLKATPGGLPPEVAAFVPDLPLGAVPGGVTRVAVGGAFKVPGLRNAELTGPYMHNGGMSTLRQVVEFYTRGGNFRADNAVNLDQELLPGIPELFNDPAKENLVAFLLTLTDNRVKTQGAPFDHPGLFVPSGAATKTATTLVDSRVAIPATGRTGGAPLGTFLDLDPISP